MRKANVVGALAAALVVAALAGADEVNWRGRVAPGQAVEVKGVNGSVVAHAGSGQQVEVRASRSGRKSDPASVEIKVVEHAGGVTICALYPTPAEGRPNECQPGEAGRMNVRDNDVKVDFTVALPKGVRLLARTVNGAVKAAGLESDVEARTVNGGIEIETSGHAAAETVNGSIQASFGRAEWQGAIALKTVNGGIDVALPGDASATVEAKTVNGGIETDFDLPVKGQHGSRRLSGTLGSGGRSLDLDTVNGAIRLRRR